MMKKMVLAGVDETRFGPTDEQRFDFNLFRLRVS